ncbi:MAG: hypothetical protein J6S85_07425 [Methanobrevibacter sp.]|nr:hypothetical protein [Methanobrevibacter sp.]
MANKQLTISQKKNRCRTFQRLTFGGEYLALATPFVAMGIVNRDEWFHYENGWKTCIGFVLAFILFSIIVTSITFESEKLNDRKGKYIKLLIGCIISAFIFVLLADIMSEIANILFAASGGIAAALGLDIASVDFKGKADTYGEIIRKAKENVAQKQVEEELKENNKDVKF